MKKLIALLLAAAMLLSLTACGSTTATDTADADATQEAARPAGKHGSLH